jgi:hypothetical protein
MLIPLQETYLNSIAAVFEADKMDTLIDRGERDIVLYGVRKGTTVPEVIVTMTFEQLGVTIHALTRNRSQLNGSVAFYEGIDGFLPQLSKFIRAGRIAAPKAA